MNPLMSEQKHKILSTVIVTMTAFLGFEALSFSIGIYQLKSSLFLSFYIYAFHILWLTFVFDLHFKERGIIDVIKLNHRGLKLFWEALKLRFKYMANWQHWRHYQNHLVLPGLAYWSTVILLFLNPFNSGLKQALVIFATITMAVGYWFFHEHISRHLEVVNWGIKILSVVKLFVAFMVYSALVGVTSYFGYDVWFLLLATFTLTFLLIYQALFQHNLLTFSIFLWIVIIAMVMAIVSMWVYGNWNAQYFSAGVVMLAIYNTLWGLLHHYLDRSLTRTVVLEYLVMLLLVISILFASHNFNQRVL